MSEAEEKRMREAFEKTITLDGKFPSNADRAESYFKDWVQSEWIGFQNAWKAALAYQDELVKAAYADAADVVKEALTICSIYHYKYPLTMERAVNAVTMSTPDDARRKLEEITK